MRQHLSPVWIAGAVAGAAGVLLVAVLPAEDPGADVLLLLLTSAVGLIALVAAARMPRDVRSVWWPLALFLVLTVVADDVYALVDAVGEPLEFPNALDGVYLLGYAAAIIGLVALVRRRGRGADLATWIDALIVTLAAASVLMVLALVPLLGTDAPVTIGTAISLSYPILDLVLLLVLLQVLWTHRLRSRSLLLLAASLLIYLAADAAFTVVAAGWWSEQSALLDAAYLAANVLLALSLTAPDASSINELPVVPEGEVTGGRLALLLASAVVVPVMAVLLDNGDQHALGRVVNVLAILVIGLLVLRVFLLLRTTRRQARMLSGQARTDALTALPNRRTWDYQGDRAVAEADSTGSSLVVAMLDVDYFKQYNDTHGHQAGDAMLVRCAQDWTQALARRGFLARYGGEEFAAILTGMSVDEAQRVLETMRTATPAPLTASVGMAERLPGASIIDTVRRADVALYAAKAAGRNRLVVADAEPGGPAPSGPSAERLPSEADPLLGAAGLLTLVLDNASDIVYRTRGLDIEWISPSVTKVLGWLPEDLVGGPATRLVSPHQDVGWVARNRQRLFDGETVYQELLLVAKDGSERWFAGTAQPHYEDGNVAGFIVSMNDIHGRWLARTELDAVNQLVSLAASSASQGVAFLDSAGAVLEVNRALRRFLGRTDAEVVGRPWLDVIHPDDLPTQREVLDRLLAGSGDVARTTARFTLPNGSTAHGEVSLAAARAADRSVQRVVVQVIDLTDEQAEQRRILRLAEVDSVTGLLSRTATLNTLDDLIADGAGSGAVAGVLLVEVNNMGLFNESLGHEVGDQVLREVAERVEDACPPGTLLGRSGKRFMVIVPDLTGVDALTELSRRLQLAQRPELTVAGRSVVVTCSIGLTIAHADESAATVLRNLHVAVGAARRSGPEGIVPFAPELAASAERRLAVEEELRVACQEGQFVLEYQPIIHLATGRTESYEALVRWMHPVMGMRPPADFLAVAEESRLIGRIGQWVLSRVCADLLAHPEVLPHVAVNVSAVEIEDPDWLASVVDVLRTSGVDPRKLTVEVTETAIFRVDRDVRRDFEVLRGMGVGIHLDDFGTGYSSLAVLRQIPATGLKLDRSFVSTLGESQNLAAGLVHMVGALGLTGIAEGIETSGQASRLLGMGWELGQGFAFGRPGQLDRWVRA